VEALSYRYKRLAIHSLLGKFGNRNIEEEKNDCGTKEVSGYFLKKITKNIY
jgi:hypothetical protein